MEIEGLFMEARFCYIFIFFSSLTMILDPA